MCGLFVRRSAGMHGFVDQRAVRGAEHRRRRRRGPEGARARCARVGCSTRTYCQPTPPAPRSTGNFAAHDARQNTAVGARPFWLLFGAMPKSNSLARRASESSAPRGTKTKIKMDSGLRRNGEPGCNQLSEISCRATPRQKIDGHRGPGPGGRRYICPLERASSVSPSAATDALQWRRGGVTEIAQSGSG